MKGLKINANKAHAEDSLFVFINEHKNTITELNLLGGEPLLQKQNLSLFELLPTQKYYILTNLTTDIPNNKIAEKLLTMPDVHWGVSFETVYDRFEYVRHGGEWSRLNSNIRYIKDSGEVQTLNAHPLYCSYSAFNLGEFYDYLLSTTDFNEAYWCVLHNTDGLNVFTLPSKMKEKAIRELERCIDNYKDTRFDMSALENIKNTLIENLNEDLNKTERQKEELQLQQITSVKNFIEWTKKIEEMHRNKTHTFCELWPHFHNELISYLS
jgi:organic radical activating enzyme